MTLQEHNVLLKLDTVAKYNEVRGSNAQSGMLLL